jgi:hypothetical protein
MVRFRSVGFFLWIRNRLQFFDQCPLHMLSHVWVVNLNRSHLLVL